MNNSENSPFYKKWWGMILIFLLFPVLIPVIVWKYTNWGKGLKITITVICVFVAIILVNNAKQSQQKLDILNAQILEEIKTKESLDVNTKLFDESKKLSSSKSNPVHEIQKQFHEAIDLDRLVNVLGSMSNEDFEKLQNNQLAIQFFSIPEVNEMFYKKLKNNLENREKYQKLIEEKRKDEKLKQEEEENKKKAESRKKRIENQFNPWDGSHIEVTKYLKKNLHDPKSYEHIDTQYKDKGDHLIIYTDFRSKNAFNAIIKTQAISIVDLDGNIQKVTITK